ncbi:conserved Plasmodium protein, unknown function [Plasmodium vivax]|uniref:Uncharacterized protein n=4 Tax=Plasmodium vivax TaxID=5855 RepID=A5K5W3_PLAVS|nr:hypothetical protein, conserved [Plasmodium vivax]KMZ88173.1 hypothetical protein PVBG_02634 [Plasmodium vivax Brazil I]KMZ94548.1 hypothetical protein PVMG_01905 [Plasmodium vivax Mauritania I]EDL45298.1 hypothetical protein, conserved [Plasmodium vivax]CAI7718893.1 conserved Plasmodium protein, unknown function [Plasmodium vivax]SCO65938.1 conserved Plasmodium protein, unknown function [Plasmodium vivax]|eukprot:XP_001615025.1 hypothetical protein [Plasmodium vivax Sal-1]
MLSEYRNSKRKRTTAHKKMNYTRSAPLKGSPFTGLNNEKEIAENPKVHSSIREKQLKIAELMLYRKNDNVVKKNVNFLPPEKKEATEEKDDVDKANKFSISNASIADSLNKKLFGNRSTWNSKTKTPPDSFKSKSGEKLSILSNYRNTFAHKEDSTITNKVNESNKENLNDFLRMKSCAYSSKSKFFAQKKVSDISKKSYSAERIVSLNSKKSGEEVDASRRGISLMQRLGGGPTNRDAADESGDDLDDGSFWDLNEDMSNGEDRDSDDNRAGDHEDSAPNSHPADNQGNKPKRNELKKSKNESPTYKNNTRSYGFFKSRKSAKTSPSDENKAKDKKRKINSFFNFLNLKKRYNKRKNDLQAKNDKKKKNNSKEEEEMNCPSSDREKSSSSHPSKKNIKTFFCVK